MEDPATPENPKDFNKIDLTQLHGFSFGTQWTQDKSSGREARRDDGPRRENESGEARRDRRNFKRPAGNSTDANTNPAPRSAPAGGGGGGASPAGEPRRTDSRGGGGPRRDGPGGGGERFSRGPRFGGNDRAPVERGPYISPFFNVTFYPEDVGFTALAKAIRTSCRTYELFEIARVIIGKNDRFVAVIQRKPPEGPSPVNAPTADGATTPAASGKPTPLAISIPDGLPFESEDAAIAHVLNHHLAQFFDAADAEIEAPKGNFQVVNRCSITGELLGPPNYHRYNQIVQQHFNARISRMPFEMYRSRIDSVRDPEAIAQWLEKMKKITRYTWKFSAEGEAPTVFDSLEDARSFLLSKAREKVVKPVDSARFHGKFLDPLPPGEIRRAVEGTLERQRRFPLDTANALRGRLRREGFTIFKKGSKGVSYVCAVKRKFRIPGQTFSDSIGALINFIESNPMVKASELPVKLLSIQTPATLVATPPAGATVSPIPTSGSMPPMSVTAATALTPEDQTRLSRLNGDLRWLVAEGYVTEFIDGCLFAPPAMTEARKQEVESDEHDPENFPEAPAKPAAAASTDGSDHAAKPEKASPEGSVEASAAVGESDVTGPAAESAQAPVAEPEESSETV